MGLKPCKFIIDFLWIIPFLLTFLTVFIINRELVNGVVIGKYFWFYPAMGMVSVVTLIFVFSRNSFFIPTILDLFVLLFVGCVVLASFYINDGSQNTTKHLLFVLLAVLYFCIRLITNPDDILTQKCIFFFIIITAFPSYKILDPFGIL